MNSVRADRIDHPGHYRWTSDHCHATERPASIVKDHEVFLQIASAPKEPVYRYRALLRTGLDARDVLNVRKAVAFSIAWKPSF
jgi:putative transposase